MDHKICSNFIACGINIFVQEYNVGHGETLDFQCQQRNGTDHGKVVTENLLQFITDCDIILIRTLVDEFEQTHLIQSYHPNSSELYNILSFLTKNGLPL